jgi:hypothetical protein
MMPRNFPVVMVVLGSLAVADCGTEVCACGFVMVPASVRGTVVREDASPVALAQVHAYSAPGKDCASLDEDFGSIPTLPDGSYDMGLGSGAVQDNVCVFVFGRPPQGASGLQGSDTVLVVLDFQQDGAIDSAQVNLVLRNR